MLKLITIISLTVLLAIYGIVSYFIVYHLRHFGIKGDVTRKMIIISITISIALITTALVLFYKIPWENFSIPTY